MSKCNMQESECILDVLHEETIDAMSRLQINRQQAADIALSIESGLRRRIGGRSHYIAANSCGIKRRLVENDVLAGVHPQVIAKRRGVSMRWVYRVKNEMVQAAG